MTSKCVKHYRDIGEELPTAGFTPDAEYPIINGEKGIVNYKYRRKLNQQGEFILKSINGGIAPNVVPEYAEAQVIIPKSRIAEVKKLAQGVEEIKLEEKENCLLVKSFGISAHGSRPDESKNAVSHLLLFLGKLDFVGSVREFLSFMNENIGLDTERRKLGICLEDEMSGKFVSNLGMLIGIEKEIDISINMRYPVTKKYEDFKHVFVNKMREGKMEELSTRHKKSLYVSPDNQFIKKLQKVYEEKVGERAELIFIGGGTYAKSMGNILAFGPIFKGQPMLEHKPDEYIEIDSLMKNVRIMAAAIYELAN
ncbi:Sapep family Mn(2+)-dependent dipeptidase [Clostridium sp.]|uniref:Sapep family Mn(2+)-dependent dipeptidase n=1 Tax=Clostridium sp. TaxID=1506 RepID=UPI003D6D00ED